MWQRLLRVLQDLTRTYQTLQELTARKRKVLIAVELEQLDVLLVQEEGVVERIRRLEDERQHLMRELSGASQTIRPDMTTSELLEQAPAAVSTRLVAVHRDLGEVVKRVRASSEENEFFIRTALGAVNYQLNRLSGATVEQGYGQQGQEQVNHHQNFDFNA